MNLHIYHNVQNTKIESILFVPIILTFSKNLRCLNFPVCEQCCQQKNSKNDQKFFESAKMKKYIIIFSHQKCLVTLFCACVSAKFKHLKYFENVKIIETNNIDSILSDMTFKWHDIICERHCIFFDKNS